MQATNEPVIAELKSLVQQDGEHIRALGGEGTKSPMASESLLGQFN